MRAPIHVARGFVPDGDGYYATYCGATGTSSHVYALATCIPCLLLAGQVDLASGLRRLELDRWLEEQGAVRIQVRSLGAALEALYLGRAAAYVAHLFATHGEPSVSWWTDRNVPAIGAAHLARQALGLAEGGENPVWSV